MDNQLDLLPPPVRKQGRPFSIPAHDMKVAEALVTSGVPYEHVAQKMGVSYDLVKKWASVYKWITPAKIERRMRERDSESELVTSKITDNSLDPLTVAAEHARKTGLGALHGFLSRAAPQFDKFTPDVPETIGEASILLKMISKAAGLDNNASTQTNVQVNVAVGPWGGKIESHRDTDD